jgi:DNA repair exonuclease SbcCD ATPase subunit
MGLFVSGSQSRGNDSSDQAQEALIHRMKDEIQTEEEVIKSLEAKCDQLHTLKTKLELDHKKILHEFNDDSLLKKKIEGELHVITLRSEKAQKEISRIEAEMRENEKKSAEQSRELLRLQMELKQEKKRLENQSRAS